MTLHLCQVTGTLVAPDGALLPQVQVQFLPAPVMARTPERTTPPGVLLAPHPVAVTTGGGAQIDVALAPGVYSVRSRSQSGREYPPFLVDVPDQSTAVLADILLPLSMPQSVYDAAASALVASKAADRAVAASEAITEAEARDSSYPSRAAFEAAELSEDIQSWSVLHAGRLLRYRRQTDGTAGSAIISANGVRGLPAETPTPLHWGAAPGATAGTNTTAMNACAAWAGHFHLPAGEYSISGPILFAPSGTTGQSVCGLAGDGPDVSVLIQTNPNADTLRFLHQDPARQYSLRPLVRGLSIRCQGATEAQTGAAIRHRHALNGAFHDIIIDGPTFGIVSERGAQCWYDRIYFRSALRAQGQLARAVFVFDHDPVAGLGTSFGNFVSNCESQAGHGVRMTFDLRAIDGLYISNCHFNHSRRQYNIAPDGTGGRFTVRELMVVNTYHDDDPVSRTEEHIFISAQGPANSVDIGALSFSNCLFRGTRPQGTRGLTISRAADGVSGLRVLRNIRFTGCEFRNFRWNSAPLGGGIIDLRLPAGASPTDLIREVTVQGCHFNDGLADNDTVNASALVLVGRGISVSGNSYRGNWTPAGPAPIRVLAGADGVNIHGETFMDPVQGPAAVSVAPAAVNVAVYGLTGPGMPVVSEIESQGSNENGTWISYSDGRQVCTRSFTLTAQNVNTAFGALFRSANMLPGANPLPRAFVETPTYTVNCRVLDAATTTFLAGAGGAEIWPEIVYCVGALQLVNRGIRVDLRAEGRWK